MKIERSAIFDALFKPNKDNERKLESLNQLTHLGKCVFFICSHLTGNTREAFSFINKSSAFKKTTYYEALKFWKESNGKVFEIKEKSADENKGIHLLLSLTL